MRRLLRAVVALAAAAAMTMTASPAVAAQVVWERVECFSGAIEAASVVDGVLSLEGHLDCASSNADARFGVAKYHADIEYGGIYAHTMGAYGPEAPSRFSIGNSVREGPVRFPLCVVTDSEVRVACVMVTRDAVTSQLVVTPLSTEDELVGRKKAGIIQRRPGETSPACGHCW